MSTILHISVENPDELLNAGAYGSGAIVRVQWSATETGTFADISGTGSTPTVPIVAATTAYTAYDPAGTSSTWYRTRYESATAARLSDWSDPFQTGGEEGGSISSLYDIKQRLKIAATDTTDDELLLEFIRRTATGIMGWTGRRFVRDPLSGTRTFLVDVTCSGRVLRIPRGIATATLLEIATTSQPESGGTYTSALAADWFLRPIEEDRDFGWPATEIVLSDMATGSVTTFTKGYNAVRWTGAMGWSEIPGDIAAISDGAVIRQYLAKGSGVAQALGGDTFSSRLLRWISPEDRATLSWYRVGRA